MKPDDLDRVLAALGLNQTTGAELLGVTPRAVRYWLHGIYRIPPWVPRMLDLVLEVGMPRTCELLDLPVPARIPLHEER